MASIRKIFTALSLVLFFGVSTASATSLRFELDNRYVDPNVGNPAGFVFTNPVDRVLVDFSNSNFELLFDPVNDDVATVTIRGSANAAPELGIANPDVPDFYSVNGLYTFDFSFAVVRHSDLQFVNPLHNSNIGTITNPLGVTETVDAMGNVNENNLSFLLNFSPDFNQITASGWVVGQTITGDFHFTGQRVPTQTEVPEPATSLLLGSSILGLAFRKRQ